MAGLGFDETELRLGLPGAGELAARSSGKRGFAETIDLKLKLQPAAPAAVSGEEGAQEDKEDADAAAAAADEKMSMKRSASQSSVVTAEPDPDKPRAPKYTLDLSSPRSLISIFVVIFMNLCGLNSCIKTV